MSIQAMTWVIDNSQQTGLGFVALLMIANHANAEGHQSFPSMKTLAKECRTSLRSVQRTILKLERSGELKVDRSSGRVSHSYSLALMPNVDTEATLHPRQRRQRGHVKTVERGQEVATLQRGHPDHVDSQRGHPGPANVDTVGLNVDTAMSTEPLEPSIEPKEPTPHSRLIAFHADRITHVPDGGAQGAAVKWLLARYSPEQCVACYRFQLTEPWRKGDVSWLTVKQKIGTFLATKSGNGSRSYVDDELARAIPAERIREMRDGR